MFCCLSYQSRFRTLCTTCIILLEYYIFVFRSCLYSRYILFVILSKLLFLWLLQVWTFVWITFFTGYIWFSSKFSIRLVHTTLGSNLTYIAFSDFFILFTFFRAVGNKWTVLSCFRLFWFLWYVIEIWRWYSATWTYLLTQEATSHESNSTISCRRLWILLRWQFFCLLISRNPDKRFSLYLFL